MDLSVTETLTRLLLRLSEAGPAALLWGRSGRQHFGRGFDRMLDLRILVEQRPATEWPVCGSCECDLDMRPLTRIADRQVAACPLDRGNDEVLDGDDLRLFRIDLTALCRQIRKANRIEGPPVEPLGAFALRVGSVGRGIRRRQYFLAPALWAKTALDTAYAIRGQADDGTVVILTPTERDLPGSVIGLLRSTQIEVMPIDAHLDDNAAEPFTLHLLQTPVSASTDEPVLSIDSGGHRACFHGADVRLTPRAFNILVVLANEAAQDAGVVNRDLLLDCLRGADDNEEVSSEQLEKVISNIRGALTSAADMPREHGRTLISSRRGIGYRLDIPPADIRIS